MPEVVTCEKVDVNQVAFADDDGDQIVFTLGEDGRSLQFAVNGGKRPPFRKLQWTPSMGTPGVGMPDIGKGFALPRKNLEKILGGLRCMVAKTGIECNIGETVSIPGVSGPQFEALAAAAAAAPDAGGYGGAYADYGGAYGGGAPKPAPKAPAKLSKKLIFRKKRSELTTRPTPLDVPEVEPSGGVVSFEDDDEEQVKIYAAKEAGQLAYSVDGKERGTFASVKYQPQMGLPALAFNTGKGIQFQAGENEATRKGVSGLRWLCKKHGLKCDIAERINVPPEIEYALEQEAAGGLMASASEAMSQ